MVAFMTAIYQSWIKTTDDQVNAQGRGKKSGKENETETEIEREEEGGRRKG